MAIYPDAATVILTRSSGKSELQTSGPKLRDASASSGPRRPRRGVDRGIPFVRLDRQSASST
jgi:hypothetical protein